jgi:hypothetical protein
MDMKKILQAMDGANSKAEVNSSDMQKFLQAVTEAELNQKPAPVTKPAVSKPVTPPSSDLTADEMVAVLSGQKTQAQIMADREAKKADTKVKEAEYDASDTAKKYVDENAGMSRLLSIISEGKGPLNRSTSAEALTMQHYTEPKKTITAPVLNVAEGATPSMIGKYFKAVEEELREASARPNERAQQLAERVVKKVIEQDITRRVTPNADGSFPDPNINRLTGKPNPPAAEPAPSNVKPGGATVEYGGKTYDVMVFGDKSIRPRISGSDTVVSAKVYTKGNNMFVMLDAPAQEGIAEDKDPCWDSHKMVGTKKKGGKTVPNCVPKK